MLAYTALLKKHKISYIGATKQSAKVLKSYKRGVLTYCIYLAPYNMSGYMVCPNAQHCHEKCLNASGHNRMAIAKDGFEGSKINRSRIKKTKLFYENREEFMAMVVAEIKKWKKYAEKHNLEFAIRLNGTSDLNPKLFVYEGKNILDLFPDVQFYDYTKVPSRLVAYHNHPNYDLTFSFDGFNWDVCEQYLQMGGRVAVVFANGNFPQTYKGYKVVNGDNYDMRYKDGNGVIVGLTYHYTANDVIDGHFVTPNDPFIVQVD